MSSEEILDLVDIEGNKVGTASKRLCHSDPNLIHPTIHFSLIDGKRSKVLLTIRSKKKKHDGGKTCFLGEHVLSGETLEDALVRGVKEELGVSVNEWEKLHKHIFYQPRQTELVTFFLASWEEDEIQFDQEEIDRTFWVTSNELLGTEFEYSDMTRYWIDTIDWKKIF